MMKHLFLIALCVVAANAIVCPEDACSLMKCKAVTACNGRVTKGICGCCDVCIVSLREGERCHAYPFMGVPILSECGFNLVCSKHTGTCIKPLTFFAGSCEDRRAEAMSRRLLGTFIPKCEADGSYSPVQCHGSVCKCVTREGDEINGFSAHIGTKMSCNCARDFENYRKLNIVGKLFRCETNGDYKRQQCLGVVTHMTVSNKNY